MNQRRSYPIMMLLPRRLRNLSVLRYYYQKSYSQRINFVAVRGKQCEYCRFYQTNIRY